MKVFVAIPAGSGVVTSGLAGFLWDIAQRRDTFFLGLVNNIKGIPIARNTLTEAFLATDCDRIFFLDADVTPPANALDILLAEGDVVAGTYPQIRMDGTGDVRLHYIVSDDDSRVLYPEDGPMEVGYVAFGCTVIRRHVLEDQRMILDGVVGKPGSVDEPRSWYREVRDPNGHLRVSDDVDFCQRARKNGYKVFCHGGVKFGHVKTIDLKMMMPGWQGTTIQTEEPAHREALA